LHFFLLTSSDCIALLHIALLINCTSPYWFFWLHCTFPYCIFDWLHFSLLHFWLIALLFIDFSDCIALLPIGLFYLIASIYWSILMFGLVWICSIGFVLVSLDWMLE
jgi:hypothetical protein